MRRSFIPAAAFVAAMAGSFVLAPMASASEGPDANHPTLRQELPLTAAAFPNKSGETCPGVPANKDGWHFVLPGGSADFVELKVTFEPGGTQVITDFSVFGNPEGKHAYVASQPGAELQKVEATITGGPLPGKGNKFPLSHTCVATPGNTTGETTTGGTTTGETTTGETTTGGSTTGGSKKDNLAETGAGAPVGIIAATALAFAAAGAVLVTRRRKAQQN